MIGKFNSLECLEQGCGLIPNVAPDAFAVAPAFDCTEELRVEIDVVNLSMISEPAQITPAAIAPAVSQSTRSAFSTQSQMSSAYFLS